MRDAEMDTAMCEACAECALVERECDACGCVGTHNGHTLRMCHVHDMSLWLCFGCAAWADTPRAWIPRALARQRLL